MRTCQFYAVGKSERELLSYDEYCDKTGIYYTDNLIMINRYNAHEAKDEAKDRLEQVYLVTIKQLSKRKDDIKTEVALMWDREDLKNDNDIKVNI